MGGLSFIQNLNLTLLYVFLKLNKYKDSFHWSFSLERAAKVLHGNTVSADSQITVGYWNKTALLHYYSNNKGGLLVLQYLELWSIKSTMVAVGLNTFLFGKAPSRWFYLIFILRLSLFRIRIRNTSVCKCVCSVAPVNLKEIKSMRTVQIVAARNKK